MKSYVVDLRREGISPAQLSRCFSLNRSTSHRWEKSPPNQTLMSLQETLLSVFEASGETYGSRRLSQAVTDLGIKIGRFKARRLMRELEIKAKCPKAKVWRKQAVDFAENSANGQCAMMPDTIWAGDITYIPTDECWLYLAIVIDWFSRLIVIWSVSDTPDSRLCVQAFATCHSPPQAPCGRYFPLRPRLPIQQPSLSECADRSENGA